MRTIGVGLLVLTCSQAIAEVPRGSAPHGTYSVHRVGDVTTWINNSKVPSCGQVGRSVLDKFDVPLEIRYDKDIRVNGEKWSRDQKTTTKDAKVGISRPARVQDLVVYIIFWNGPNAAHGSLLAMGFDDSGKLRCEDGSELVGTYVK